MAGINYRSKELAKNRQNTRRLGGYDDYKYNRNKSPTICTRVLSVTNSTVGVGTGSYQIPITQFDRLWCHFWTLVWLMVLRQPLPIYFLHRPY